MQRTWIVAGSTAVLALALVGCQPKGATSKCDLKAIQAMAPEDITVEKVEHLDKPVAHCKIDGFAITAKPGTQPGPGKAYWRLQLPDKALFNGRYFFIGLGGAAGFVPTEAQVPRGNPIVKGFAVAGTDTGHQAPVTDWSFLDQPIPALDHIHRAAHVVAVATQDITKKYYGVDKIWRYHTGCSGGGRMGGMAAQYHPEDYDGILLGDGRVSNRKMSGGGMMKMIHATQVLNAEPGAWISPEKLDTIDKAVTAACDETDGAKDQVVWDHRLCHYDVAKLTCKGADGPDCLTPPQVRAMKKLLDGPRDAKGELLSQPMPITNVTTWATFIGRSPPPWSPDPSDENRAKTSNFYTIANTHARGMFRQDFDVLKDFDLKNPKDIKAWEDISAKQGFEGAPDLTQLEKSGGKVILYVGVSSPCCSNVEMEGYVHDVAAKEGMDRVAKYMALYHIPGTGHCSGGTGPADHPDALLQTLIDWVEQGKQPGSVVTHSADKAQYFLGAPPTTSGVIGIPLPTTTGASREFLLCPYPQKSVFDASKASTPGAVYAAANWSCKGA